MEKVSLYIKRLNADGEEEYFPNASMPAVITAYEYTAQRMGSAPVIEAELMYPECLDNLWREDGYGAAYVEFGGEKFYVSQVPSSSKDNTDMRYRHEVQFTSERVVLDNIYAYDVVTESTEEQYADRYRSNTTSFSFYGDINEFVARINDSLVYSGVLAISTDEDGNKVYDGFCVVVDDGIETDSLEVSFEDLKVSEALQEIYNVYELTFYWVGKVCHVGAAYYVLEDELEYGRDNPLLSIEKENANTQMVDRVTGYGGSTNLQYYYPNESAVGTAVWECENIEESEVVEVDLEDIIKYTNNYIGTWIYCERDESLPTSDVAAFLYPHLDGSGNDVAVSDKTAVVTTTVTPMDDTEYSSGYSSSTGYYSAQQTLYTWEFGMYVKGYAGASLLVSEDECVLYYTVEGTAKKAMSTTFMESLSEAWTDDYSYYLYSGKAVIVGTITEEGTETEEVFAPTHSYTFQDDGLYYVKMKCYFFYPTYMKASDAEQEGQAETAEWEFTLDTGIYYSMAEGDEQYFLYGTTGEDTDGYDTVAYGESGIEFTDASAAASVSTSFAIKTSEEEGDDGTYATVEWEVTVTGDTTTAATIIITDRKWMTPCSKLMPSIYRETLGADRFYPAVNYPITDDDGNETADERYLVPDSTDGDYYVFENEYEKGDPHEAITEDEDIYPTIVGITNGDGELIAEVLDIAYDGEDSDALTDDSDEDNPEYIHSYFYIKLRVFSGEYGFNIFTHASYSEEAYLTLTSGNCSACTFQIAVEKEENDEGTGYNFYNPVLTDDEGNLLKQTEFEPGDEDYYGDYILPIGYKSQYTDRQQDTSASEVWIAVKKDNETFGVVMPNVLCSYYPSIGDSFVLTGIGLPQVYIDAAESRLDEYLIQYMSENNTETFTYTVKFSRIWIATHEELAGKISENSLIAVKYNGEVHNLYVSSYTCKADENILYEIEVELSDEITLGESTLRTEVDGLKGSVGALASLLNSSSPSSSGGLTLSAANKKFLRKDQDDTAAGTITFEAGAKFGDGYSITEEGEATLKDVQAETIEVTDKATFGDGYSIDSSGNAVLNDITANDIETKGDVKSDNYDYDTQQGFSITRSSDGSYKANLANLEVWGKATFNTLEIRRLSAIGGALVVSAAASTLKYVVEYYVSSELTGWKCYYLADDGTTATQNGWQVGDQARCESFNIEEGTYENVGNKDYWRCVIAVSEEDEQITDSSGNVLFDGQKFGWIVLGLKNCQLTDYGCDDDDATAPQSGYEYLSIPAADDVIVLEGHQLQSGETSDSVGERMNAILISASHSDSPKIVMYTGIYTFSLDGRQVFYASPEGVNINNDSFTWTYGSVSVPNATYWGVWSEGSTAPYYSIWTYDGDLWRWDGDGSTDTEPSEENGWTRLTWNNTGNILEVEQSLGGFIYADETETVTFSVWKYDRSEEVTDDYTFVVSRDSGDESSDAVWDAANGYLSGNTIDLDIDDMNLTGRTSLTTKFWVTATYTDGTTEEAVVEY